MKTNRSPLNQQDQDSHEFDHKPAESDIKMAKIANAKMKKLRINLLIINLIKMKN